MFFSTDLDNLRWILGAIVVGAAVAVPAARRVQMTQMPQLVALFNGVGGGAAAVVAMLELSTLSGVSSFTGEQRGNLAAIAFTVLVGSVSFAGSGVTFAKLQELIDDPAGHPSRARPLLIGGLVVGVAAALGRCSSPACCGSQSPAGRWPRARCHALVLPVGGADVPIVISLLNAFTGLTVAASGGFCCATPCCWSPERSSARAAPS